jgi:hypothetical protein
MNALMIGLSIPDQIKSGMIVAGDVWNFWFGIWRYAE